MRTDRRLPFLLSCSSCSSVTCSVFFRQLVVDFSSASSDWIHVKICGWNSPKAKRSLFSFTFKCSVTSACTPFSFCWTSDKVAQLNRRSSSGYRMVQDIFILRFCSHTTWTIAEQLYYQRIQAQHKLCASYLKDLISGIPVAPGIVTGCRHATYATSNFTFTLCELDVKLGVYQ